MAADEQVLIECQFLSKGLNNVGLATKRFQKLGTIVKQTDQVIHKNGITFTKSTAIVRAEQSALKKLATAMKGTGKNLVGGTAKTIGPAASPLGQSIKQAGLLERSVKKVGKGVTAFSNTHSKFRKFSHSVTAMNMSMLGTFFSTYSLITLLTRGMTSLFTPLADIEGMFTSLGMAVGLGGDTAQTVIDQFGGMDNVTDTLVEGWKGFTGTMETLKLEFMLFAAEIFPKIQPALENLVELLAVKLSDPKIQDAIVRLVEAFAGIVPELVDMLPTIAVLIEYLSETGLLGKLVALAAAAMLLMPLISGMTMMVQVGSIAWSTLSAIAAVFGITISAVTTGVVLLGVGIGLLIVWIMNAAGVWDDFVRIIAEGCEWALAAVEGLMSAIYNLLSLIPGLQSVMDMLGVGGAISGIRNLRATASYSSDYYGTDTAPTGNVGTSTVRETNTIYLPESWYYDPSLENKASQVQYYTVG